MTSTDCFGVKLYLEDTPLFKRLAYSTKKWKTRLAETAFNDLLITMDELTEVKKRRESNDS